MTPKLLPLFVGLGIGYLAGTHAGREKYDALKARVEAVWDSPRIAAARHDVEAYARQQAPVIRERAEAAAKAAPGAIADTAKEVASKTSEVARDVAAKTSEVAHTVADKTAATAKEVAGKTAATARAVALKTSTTASDVRAQAAKTAAGVRGRGEDAAAGALTAAGRARDEALYDPSDDDAPRTAG